jgi:uncharacterized membrane protein YhiD involved in acid resistance
MATGAGLYSLAVLGAVLVLVVLSLLDRFEAYARRRMGLPANDDHTHPRGASPRGSEGHMEDLE